MRSVVAAAAAAALFCCLGCERVDSVRALSISPTNYLASNQLRAVRPPPLAPLPTADKTNFAACVRCASTGKVACTARDCDHGKLECPGPCLKLSKGTWEHLEVPSHAPDELWQKFYDSDGKWHAWNQSHVGEVVELQQGKAVSIGKCQFCAGTTVVNCGHCQGTGEIVCPDCGGRPMPVLAAIFKTGTPPKTITLRNGKTLIGRTEMRIGSRIFVRTADGGQIEMDASQVVSETPIVETSKR